MAAATTTHQMRTAPRSPAVESFLRNFERERQRLQEVLEVTLCYGVFCLSQNFSLKGMSVEELRAVTSASFAACVVCDHSCRHVSGLPISECTA